MRSNPFENLGGSPLPVYTGLTDEQSSLIKNLAKTTSALNAELAKNAGAARLIQADILSQMVPTCAIDEALAAKNRTFARAADALSMSAIADRHALGFGLSAYAKDLLSGDNMADYAARQLGHTAADAWARQDAYFRDALAGAVALPDFQTLADSLPLNALMEPHSSGVLTVGEWQGNETAKALNDYARQLSAINDVGSVNAQFGMANGDAFGKQLTEQLYRFLPKGYGEDLQSVLGGIDFDAIRTASEAASTRVYEAYRQGNAADFNDLTDAVERADLTDVRTVIAEVVAAAFQEARDRGELRAAPSQWTLFFLTTLIAVLMTASQIIGQPIFAHHYEKEHAPAAPLPKHSPRHDRFQTASVRHMASQQHASSSSVTVSARFDFDGKKVPATASAVVVSQRLLTLFLGPDTKQRHIGTVPAGQLLQQLRTKRDWVFVRYVDPRGEGAHIAGWVRERHVRSLEVETQRLILCELDAGASKERRRCD